MHSNTSKNKAISLRKQGRSLNFISKELQIPKTTLYYWIKNIPLSKQQKELLHKEKLESLKKARSKAVRWHNTEKERRIKEAKQKALESFEQIDIEDKEILKLALALLYLGEGSKKVSDTGMGNSDPIILLFFIKALKIIYGLQTKDFRCYLHLRDDQDEIQIKTYWSRTLGIPQSQFRKTLFDKRTAGKKTFKDYKGVCLISVGKVAIQRELVFLSRMFCDKVCNHKSD